MGVIYKITSPTEKVYVGKTTNLKIRIYAYRWRMNKCNTIIANSIRKYGWKAHLFEVLETIEDEKILGEREVFWIKELNTYCHLNKNGMNMTIGGEGQSGNLWGKSNPERHKKNSTFNFKGRKHTPESIEIMSNMAKERNKATGRKFPRWVSEKSWEKSRKPLYCYNVSGDKIGEYSCKADAAKKLGIRSSCIQTALSRNHWAAGKYFFVYKENGEYQHIPIENIYAQNVRRPVLCFIGNNCIEYDSAFEAADELKIPKTTINRAALYNKYHPIRNGYIFAYKDLHLVD